MRKISLLSLLLISSLLLTSCIRQEGAIGINPDGTVEGLIVYGFNKELLATLGVRSQEDLVEKDPETKNDISQSCFDASFEEVSTEFVFSCQYKNAKLMTGDITSKIVGDKIIFTMKANLENASQNSSIKLGSIVLRIQFPGVIEQIVKNKEIFVTKSDETSVKIEGYASDPIDVKITAECGGICSSNTAEMSKNFVPAPKNFGGLIQANTVMRKVDSPFNIESMIQIPLGKTLLVEPGVEIIAKFPSNLDYRDRSVFFNQGRVFLAGEEGARIKIDSDAYRIFRTENSKGASSVEARFVDFSGGEYLLGGGSTGYSQVKISDSFINNLKRGWNIYQPSRLMLVERNIFKNSAGLEVVIGAPENTTLPNLIIENNKFIGLPLDAQGKEPRGCWIAVRSANRSEVIIKNNDFSSVGERAICVGSEPSMQVVAKGNFWGTDSIPEIKRRVFDSEDALTAATKVDVNEPLSANPFDVDSGLKAFSSYVDSFKEPARPTPSPSPKSDKEAAVAAKKIPASVNTKERTITCVAGKSKLRVIGKKPVCPVGYKKK